MTDDDTGDFLDLMASEGVKPLNHQQKADLKPEKADALTVVERRLSAQGGAGEGLSTEHVALVNPLDPLEWKRDGVQEGVYRNLRLGKYSADARLDLQRLPVPRAQHELIEFLDQCIQYGIRTVLINHGRGRDPESAPNRLKSFLNQWLRELPQVMAFHTAQKHHGGLGSIYILLRKSEEQRLQNWEQHQKR